MICLFGLGQKAFTSLKNLNDSELQLLEKVVIGKDVNVVNDYSRELVEYCISKNITFQYRKKFQGSDSEILIAIGWRWLIDKYENQKLIVFHDSILPRYRGFNPLVTALINGDKEIGVTALYGEEEFDSGDIIAIEKCSVKYPIKVKEAIEMVSTCYSKLLKNIIHKIRSEELRGYKQNKKEVSYSVWRDFEDYYIDWTDSSARIKRKIDAVGFPYLGARTKVNDEEYIIHEASIIDDIIIENRVPGKVLFKEKGKPIVICGKGLLRIDNLTTTTSEVNDFPTKFRIRFK